MAKILDMHKSITIILLALLPLTAVAREQKQTVMLRDSLIEFSKQHIGCRYKYGAKGPKTFDCSGFSGYVFSHFGYTLNASSSSQFLQGEKVKASKAKVGDLIFFKGSNASKRAVGHVGIVCGISGDSLQFIHASTKRGITIDYYPGVDYYNKRFIGLKRIIGEVEREAEETEETEEAVEQENAPANSTDASKPEPEESKEKIADETEKRHHPKDAPTQETTTDSTQLLVDVEPETPTECTQEEQTQQEETELCDIQHTVKKGDTLYRLSKTYGCSTNDIINWNSLRGNNIKIGQILIIKKASEENSLEKD